MVQAMPKDGRWTAPVMIDFLNEKGMHNYLCDTVPIASELLAPAMGHTCWRCKSIHESVLNADIEAYGELNAQT